MALELSTTAFSHATRCMKMYEYADILQLVPRPRDIAPKLRKGIWIHKILEDWYSEGVMMANTISRLQLWAREHDVPEETIETTTNEVLALMENYFNHYAERDDKVVGDVVFHEERLYLHIESLDTTVRATLDSGVRRRDGEGVWIVEHKSTGDIPDASWRAVDPQTAIQCLVAIKNKIDIEGIVFNYLLTDTPKVPQVVGLGDKQFEYGKKGPRFDARAAVTTSTKFEEGWRELYSHWKGNFGEAMAYKEEMEAKLVADGKWFQQYEVFRPVGMLRQTAIDLLDTIRDIKAAMEAGRFRRSFNVFTCPRFCSYNQLCVAEYIKGAAAPDMREELFMIDDGDREGRW